MKEPLQARSWQTGAAAHRTHTAVAASEMAGAAHLPLLENPSAVRC